MTTLPNPQTSLPACPRAVIAWTALNLCAEDAGPVLAKMAHDALCKIARRSKHAFLIAAVRN